MSGFAFKTIDDPFAGAPIPGLQPPATELNGVNDSGMIVGHSQNSNYQQNDFIYDCGAWTTLSNSSFLGATPEEINNSGEVVGFYPTGSGMAGFTESGGVWTSIAYPMSNYTWAKGVNNSGAVVGYYYSSPSPGALDTHGFIYANGQYTTIDDPSAVGSLGETTTYPQAINDSGEIVGNYTDANGVSHGFTDVNGVFTTLDDPQGVKGTYAEGVDKAGDIVGYYQDSSYRAHGFIYHNGVFNTVENPATWSGVGGTYLSGVNSNGTEAVGYYTDANYVEHGFSFGLANNSADFSCDGASDILWRNASGLTYLWEMNGATVSSGAPTSLQAGTNWQVLGVDDFDANGTADILWRYDNAANSSDPLNGATYISFQNGATSTSASGLTSWQADQGWQLEGVGDFNGDGASDVLWRNSAAGQTYIWEMNGKQVLSSSGFTSTQETNPNWQVAGVDNFSNGVSDILWRYDNAANASDSLNGAVYLWEMNGTSVMDGALIGNPGANWQVAGTGDFDGSGAADILFRYNNGANASDPLNGVTYIDFMNGATVTSGAPTQWQVDNSWTIAGIGDFNGDGKSDILWQNSTSGTSYLWEMNGASVASGNPTSWQVGTDWSVQHGKLMG